jgi:hypothetical protein
MHLSVAVDPVKSPMGPQVKLCERFFQQTRVCSGEVSCWTKRLRGPLFHPLRTAAGSHSLTRHSGAKKLLRMKIHY